MSINIADKIAALGLGLTVKVASRGRAATGKTAPTHGIVYDAANGRLRAWYAKFDPSIMDGRKALLPEFVEIERDSPNYNEVTDVLFEYAAETFRAHLAAVQRNVPTWQGSFVSKPRAVKETSGVDIEEEIDEAA
jgi:hypothetical protein